MHHLLPQRSHGSYNFVFLQAKGKLLSSLRFAGCVCIVMLSTLVLFCFLTAHEKITTEYYTFFFNGSESEYYIDNG